MNKIRLDQYLVENNYFETKSKANANIMMGNVYVNKNPETKAGYFVKDDDNITIKKMGPDYVGRGALKLENVKEVKNIDFNNKIIFDIGASTGGFTDFALKNGASKVYAIDVGYGQLAYKLRNDERVFNYEKTNARHFFDNEDNNKFKDFADIVLIDVSFISLKHILPVAKTLLKKSGVIISLIKPQFEAKRDEVSKGKGIIKSDEIRKRVVGEIVDFAKSIELENKYIAPSPISGAKGNVEFIATFNKG